MEKAEQKEWNLWEIYDDTQLQELEKLNEAYKAFLDAGKTERECVKLAKEEAEKVLRDFEAHRGEVFMDPEMKHILGTVEFSVGYAFYPEDGTDYHVLMHISDERMYEEKKKRKGRRGREE